MINKSNRSDDSSKLFRSFGLHIKKITNFQIHSDVSPFNFSGESKESDRWNKCDESFTFLIASPYVWAQ